MINKKVDIIPKKIVTHDLSFNRKKGKSVNQRFQEDKVPEVIFGHSMLRYLHLIHHLNWTHPNTRIIFNKIYVNKSYRRLHTKASVAAKYIAIWFLEKMWKNQYKKSDNQVAILLTRLPFGSAPAPGEFCITSETVFDLANDLIQFKEWYPLVLPYPYAQQLTKPLILDDDVIFGAAEEADFNMDTQCKGGADGYVDSRATAVLDSPINGKIVPRSGQAVLMSLFIIYRPLDGALEPIKRPYPA